MTEERCLTILDADIMVNGPSSSAIDTWIDRDCMSIIHIYSSQTMLYILSGGSRIPLVILIAVHIVWSKELL